MLVTKSHDCLYGYLTNQMAPLIQPLHNVGYQVIWLFVWLFNQSNMGGGVDKETMLQSAQPPIYSAWHGSTASSVLRQMRVPGYSQNRKQVKNVSKSSSNHPVEGVLQPERRNIQKKKGGVLLYACAIWAMRVYEYSSHQNNRLMMW